MLAAALLVAPAASSACIPTCDVVSAGRNGVRLMFVPAVTLLQSGDSVTWASSEGLGHVAASGTPRDSSYCFFASFNELETASVLFLLDGGALFAVDGRGEPQVCEEARALPAGGFALDYYCPLHPTDMTAELVVQP